MSGKPTDQSGASPVAAPQIFDAKRVALRQERAARRRAHHHEPQFLLARIAEDIAERLLMINRQFEKALLIAPDDFEGILQPYIHPEKHPQSLITSPLQKLGPTLREHSGFDLIISVMAHHNENDPQGLFKALKTHMVDDGHIMTVCLGGDSFSQLRQSLYAADQSQFGGVASRFHPVMDIKKNAQLLAHCGFSLTMGDRDRLTVHYKQLSTLIDDIRDLGESYALTAKPSSHTSREYWKKAAQIYRAEHSENERLIAHFDILWASGWTPHHSQQKPLKPGSSQVHISEIFKP